MSQSSIIIFTRTVHDAQRVAIILRHLNFPAIPLHGQMSQSARLGALAKFKGGERSILVATDVASRGLDIPHVDLVINFDTPTNSKDYIHRVGRTARAGRSGKSVTIVTQYDVELVQRIEAVIGKKMADWVVNKEEVALFEERVEEAGRLAATEMRNAESGGNKRKRHGKTGDRRDDRDRDDDMVEAGVPSQKFKRKRR